MKKLKKIYLSITGKNWWTVSKLAKWLKLSVVTVKKYAVKNSWQVKKKGIKSEWLINWNSVSDWLKKQPYK